jgi:MOSC domain-containing protein YiiM
MARIIAVCTSETKGVSKRCIPEGLFKEDYGLVGDAHADGDTHRQVSLLAETSIEKMRRLGLDVKSGDFAENLTVEGMELCSLPIGTYLNVGDEVVLQLTQIGKECHTGCAIFKQVGKCIMPKEGIFARVIHGGRIRIGDDIRIKRWRERSLDR